jgi:hypothetical protein
MYAFLIRHFGGQYIFTDRINSVDDITAVLAISPTTNVNFSVPYIGTRTCMSSQGVQKIY